MYHGDQSLEMFLDMVGRHEHTVREPYLAFVWLETPGKDVDDGALPGAVLADEAMHFARLHNQVDSIDGQLATEMLGDPPHFKGVGPYGLYHVSLGSSWHDAVFAQLTVSPALAGLTASQEVPSYVVVSSPCVSRPGRPSARGCS